MYIYIYMYIRVNIDIQCACTICPAHPDFSSCEEQWLVSALISVLVSQLCTLGIDGGLTSYKMFSRMSVYWCLQPYSWGGGQSACECECAWHAFKSCQSFYSCCILTRLNSLSSWTTLCHACNNDRNTKGKTLLRLNYYKNWTRMQSIEYLQVHEDPLQRSAP